MRKIILNAGALLDKVRKEAPVVHHLTNWVTVYDCAQVVKSFGASPVMAHAVEEAGEMSGIASALVLNIGTLTVDVLEAMKKACGAANRKGIPVVLDCCGAGATRFRDESCLALVRNFRIDIIKGNASEICRMAGDDARTKGVDSLDDGKDAARTAQKLALRRNCAVVVTGKEDVVTDGRRVFIIRNGNEMMAKVVGTGCMAASVIGSFAAVEKDFVGAAVCGLVCFEIAAELAAKQSKGPGSFKEGLFDRIYLLEKNIVRDLQQVYTVDTASGG
ncbi:MAG: hydroxyethylthiazole kinase [Candidatus Omnitrophota bacterium]|jgi:hydroxyethylthiazole kinase